ncbi:diguanylate cyclase (GGDEF) domain-containing protein [Butyrivibrio fibrisolvens DSM 3071]|uniref:Diguanylate cyclase (GGDEF) domain-containing protein n=1 Tax=Butyrivibrio fibrisolvens DSM 3071 TaxID=1121131 RepID=A0A1M6C4L9_BUTFI|nr:GGDEF domain-containing protein [Butyrivibrio fibrisolvens]SHI55976.1 diguanylate cyclase (GGDEF) domain-containing protein [Butyrivibrio fibrisolvens DSM 3071]
MLKIGLLVSNLKSEEISNFCAGAIRAAEKEGIFLTILPGGKILSDEQKENIESFEYQETVIFDYVNGDNFDGLLIDIDKIGEDVSDFDKDRFLGRFLSERIPFLTLSEFRDHKTINNPWKKHDMIQGYQAVLDMENYITAGELPLPKDDICIPPIETTAADTMKQLGIMVDKIIHTSGNGVDIYKKIMTTLAHGGVKNAIILVYGDGIANTPKNPWIMPETILVKGILNDGKILDLPKGTIVGTMNLLDESTEEAMNPGGWIVRTLFYNENQNGVIAIKVSPQYMIPGFESLMYEIIQAAVNDAFKNVICQSMAEEIRALQEEVERGDSILDRLGEKDLMTNEYNRRGFFTHAYDYMQNEYTEGRYAIISYVDLDTITTINDLYGRPEGNNAVKRTAKVLHNVFGEDALVGRIRGNEFAVLLITDRKDKIDYLRASMQQQNARLMAEQDKPYTIHLMFVISSFEYNKNIRLEDMLKEADQSLRNMKDMI